MVLGLLKIVRVSQARPYGYDESAPDLKLLMVHHARRGEKAKQWAAAQ